MNKENKNKIKSFTDLTTWQEAHKLVVMIYEITEKFPKKETYSLVDQMRRSSVSITSNIAEGFGRHSYKEKLRFYYLSQGSLTELKNQIIVAQDVNYLSKESLNKLIEQANKSHRLLQGLISKTKEILNS
jgi:four helix bundle protein